MNLFIFVYFVSNNLLCLAIDRYWAICRPTNYKQRYQLWFLLCFGFNVCGSLEIIATLAPYYQLVNGTVCQPSALTTYKSIAPVIWFLVNYVSPSTILLGLYGRIAMEVLRRAKSLQQVRSSSPAAAVQLSTLPRITPEMMKLTIAMLVLSLLFILCYAMSRIGTFLNILGWVDFKPNTPIQYLATSLATSFSSLSSFIYVALLSTYQKRILRMLTLLPSCLGGETVNNNNWSSAAAVSQSRSRPEDGGSNHRSPRIRPTDFYVISHRLNDKK
jgi:hypothetical protein